MSKAMDALDYVGKHCIVWQSPYFAECITLLRDYITTTEVEKQKLLWDWKADTERIELHFAARIKELEEAAINAISVMKFYAIPPQKTASQTPQRICDMQAYGLIEKIEKIMAKDAALDGARKVEPEGLKGGR